VDEVGCWIKGDDHAGGVLVSLLPNKIWLPRGKNLGVGNFILIN